MTPHPITRRGKTVWTIDGRSEGFGRLFGADREAVLRKLRTKMGGFDRIEFTDQDRLAKQEMADKGTLLEAVRFYLAHKPSGIKKPLYEAIHECVALKAKRNRRPAYLAHLKFILRQFQTFVGDVQCSDLTSRHIEKFLDSKPWAATTRDGMRNRLSAFFGWSKKQGYCALNPVDAIEAESVEKQRPRIFSVEQVQRLLDTAHVLDPSLLAYLALGMFCGLRPEELQRLPGDSVKLEQGIVDIPPHVSKTRDRRIVELSDNARAWLRLCPSFARGYSHATFRRRHRALTRLAHVVWSPDVMRHTFASYHIAKHESADKTAHELGHHGSTRMLFRHYKATVTKEDAAQFWSLEPVVLLSVVAAATGTEG